MQPKGKDTQDAHYKDRKMLDVIHSAQVGGVQEILTL